MFIGKLPEVSRRAFLRRSAQLASLGAASSYALGLAGIGEAAAFSSADGYKALTEALKKSGQWQGQEASQQ
jgi:hypothetical protein